MSRACICKGLKFKANRGASDFDRSVVDSAENDHVYAPPLAFHREALTGENGRVVGASRSAKSDERSNQFHITNTEGAVANDAPKWVALR